VKERHLQFMLRDEYEAHKLADLSAAYAKEADGFPDLLPLGLELEIVEAHGEGVPRHQCDGAAFHHTGKGWVRPPIPLPIGARKPQNNRLL
jgi:hypothetical protein